MRLIVLVNVIFGILEDSVITTITTRLHLHEPPRTAMPQSPKSPIANHPPSNHLAAHSPGHHYHGGGSFFSDSLLPCAPRLPSTLHPDMVRSAQSPIILAGGGVRIFFTAWVPTLGTCPSPSPSAHRLLRRLGSARRGGERGGGTLYLTPTAQEGICPLLLSELADPQLASNRKLHDELLHRRPQRDRLHRGRHLRHGTPWEECILVSCRHSAPLRSKQGVHVAQRQQQQHQQQDLQ